MFSGVYLNRDTSKLMIAERLEDGSRRIMETPLVLEYYVPDARGKYVGIDGVVLRKIAVKNLRQFYQVKKDEAAKKKEDPNYRTYGLDANITHQTMYKFYKQNYGECPTPELHKSFFDIEVDLGNEKGVSIAELIEKGHKPINAISIYNNWEQKLYTAALYPPTLEKEEADAIIADYPDALMFDDEKKLIKQFIQWFSDADIEVGWNSGRFDIPYIIQRIKTLFADEGEYAVNEVLESLSPFLALPQGKEKTTEFGDKYTEYDIPGVWLADMMVIYKKHTTHEHESYKLDNIADEELGERKVAYEGTLDDLFRDDFKTFIDYNRQDTMLVYKLDKKTNYLNLHNMQAHELMIPLDVTMGTVGWFSQAVINYAKDHDQIVPDRWEARQAQWEGIKAPGAFVQNPVPGLHQWVSDMDMTSLYPSVIRCLNMSPETIVGQMRLEYTLPYLRDKIIKNGLWEKMAKRIPNWAKAWSGDEMFGTLEYQLIMKKSDAVITCDYEDGKVYKMTGAQWYDFIFNQGNQICISAFGTLYRTDIEGIVPALLTKWFGERKAYKKKMKAYEDMLDGIELPPDFDRVALEAELKKSADIRTVENEFEVKVVTGLLSAKNYKELAVYMVEHNLKLGNKFIASGNIEYLESKQKLYDLMQYIKKIVINSSYGATLSESCIAYDFRLGSSTTLTGRLVTKHMAERINEYTIKKCIYTGGTLIGGDTDSNYFSIGCKAFRDANPDFVYTKEKVVQYVDKLTAYVDGTFAEAMKEHHHVDNEHADIMHCAREIVGDYGLYIKKKRYAIMVYDDEGHRQDVDGKPGELKIRGIQTQRADMPKAVKKLLKDMLVKVLTGGTEQEVQKMIVDFSQSEWDVEPWKKGTPKPVNKLNQYMEKLKEGCDGMTAQKITIPSQVRGAINWNNLIDYYGDTQTKKFAGGEKCLMCKLKPDNMLKLDVVCIPIDIDPTTIPQWFKDLPFDAERTDEAVINKTIDSIFGILGWDLHLSSLTKAVVDDSDLDIQML